ncbi:MAG: c-type cytochrome [Deltaproteobacteria bacterium]|nr:c-type cytochrome [Deltaproteobacteria bacterium]
MKWVGTVDLNGFPAKPNSPSAWCPRWPARRPPADRWCSTRSASACHSLGGAGGKVGPALDGVANRRDADYLKRWISDPPGIKPDTKMPRLPLTEAQIDELVGFLSTQKG